MLRKQNVSSLVEQSRQSRTDHDRSGKITTYQDRSRQNRTDHDRSRQNRKYHDRTGNIRQSRDRTWSHLFDVRSFGGGNVSSLAEQTRTDDHRSPKSRTKHTRAHTRAHTPTTKLGFGNRGNIKIHRTDPISSLLSRYFRTDISGICMI